MYSLCFWKSVCFTNTTNLTNAKGIIQAYQDFAEFQETAATKLMENTQYHGVLPVLIPEMN